MFLRENLFIWNKMSELKWKISISLKGLAIEKHGDYKYVILQNESGGYDAV